MIVLKLSDVEKIYPANDTGTAQVTALSGINLEVSTGEFVMLVGPSGSGKTTLLQISSGLDRPTRGSVWIGDLQVSHVKESELVKLRRDDIAFVFQSHNLFPMLTAVENVEYPLIMRGVTSAEARKVSLSALQRVGLGGRENSRPSQMSGGQQQRVAIARALVTRPKLIFADEPTASLDSKSAEDLVRLFQELNSVEKMTFVFSTHDPRLQPHARRVIRLVDGRVESDRPQTPAN
ncbi:MAG: ABC transporter ATP-binding protein [Bdellovibrionales bacterium]|nr:ABC transporter ATP-binding protein [Bdellovibrionales bacterium]